MLCGNKFLDMTDITLQLAKEGDVKQTTITISPEAMSLMQSFAYNALFDPESVHNTLSQLAVIMQPQLEQVKAAFGSSENWDGLAVKSVANPNVAPAEEKKAE